jgi:hypothetical protein
LHFMPLLTKELLEIDESTKILSWEAT